MKTKLRSVLEVWLWTNRVPQAKLARWMGVSRQRAHDWVTGRRVPGKHNAARLSAITDGQVSVVDLLFPESIDPKRLSVDYPDCQGAQGAPFPHK